MILTDTLRGQHAQLAAMFGELSRLGVSGAGGRQRLQHTRQVMLAHFSLEETRLYPALLAYPATCGVAQRYAREMLQLTPALLAFFDTYGDGDADPRAFAPSLEQMLAVLRQRIQREEAQLYPAYEAHCEPAP